MVARGVRQVESGPNPGASSEHTLATGHRRLSSRLASAHTQAGRCGSAACWRRYGAAARAHGSAPLPLATYAHHARDLNRVVAAHGYDWIYHHPAGDPLSGINLSSPSPPIQIG